MKTATMLIILLSHHGYWLGGQSQSIVAKWAVEQKMPAAIIYWELRIGSARLAGGETAMPENGPSKPIEITAPAVRTRTQMQWVYRLTARNHGKEMDSGIEEISVFPSLPWKEISSHLADQRLFVVDQPDRLPAFLANVKIQITSLTDPADLQSVRAGIVIVGNDKLCNSPLGQAPLISLAKSGAQVLILQQRHLVTLGGYALRPRDDLARVCWREDHPLLLGLSCDDLKSWLKGTPDLMAIRLPRDEAALEIAYWPREIPGKEPAPIDALLAVKAIGQGRLVYSQIPLGDWNNDPRSQMFLYNALNYLQTRPEPTPPPSQRPTSQPLAPHPTPSITIPPGDNP